MHAALLPPFVLGDACRSCTTSIGVVVIGRAFPAAEGLLAAAAQALYQAKAAGCGRSVVVALDAPRTAGATGG